MVVVHQQTNQLGPQHNNTMALLPANHSNKAEPANQQFEIIQASSTHPTPTTTIYNMTTKCGLSSGNLVFQPRAWLLKSVS
jgi:hypothetical protein